MERSKYQTGEVARLKRSDLRAHPRNPRKLPPAAAKKLRENIKKVGLLGPSIIFNVASERVLSGHQRLAALDALHKGEDYELDVTLVEMDDETEKAQLIFLNNEFAQGTWDAEILGPLLTESPGAIDAAGFTLLEAQALLNGTQWGDLIASLDAATPTLASTLDKLGEMKSAAKGEPETEEVDDYEARREEMKAKKAKFAETTGDAGVREENNVEKYVVCVFSTIEQMKEFALLCGEDENAKYVDGETVLKKLRPKAR